MKTIYDALKKDHQAVKKLLGELVALNSGDEERKDELLEEIRDALIPHSRAEESVFYNSIRAVDKSDKNLVMHSYKEHLQAEALLRTLQMKDKVNADWLTTARELKAALDEHIREEEGEVFRAAQQIFSVKEAEMMAKAFEKLKPEVREEGFMGTTLDMVVNLMPPRLTDSFRSAFGGERSTIDS